MMVRSNVDLSRFNTFGLPSIAEEYFPLTQIEQLDHKAFSRQPSLILGGGSNILLLDKVKGLTIHMLINGILASDGKGFFRVGGGTDWNQFVRYTLESGFNGLENLVLIPGTVGAAPVQNIGAYGAEVAETIIAVHVYEYHKGLRVLKPQDCQFSYRDSIFKQHPGKFLIVGVDFDLSKKRPLRIHYGSIQQELDSLQIKKPTAIDVAKAVTRIRLSKLPDWFFLGNSGSFFKNPIVPISTFKKIQQQFPTAPMYPIDDTRVKLAAGWLIDKAGLRGERQGEVGSYSGQALVLINYGGATGQEILAFSQKIVSRVKELFDVELEREVRLIQ